MLVTLFPTVVDVTRGLWEDYPYLTKTHYYDWKALLNPEPFCPTKVCLALGIPLRITDEDEPPF